MTTNCACGCGASLKPESIEAGATFIYGHQSSVRRGVARKQWPSARPMPPPRKCGCGCGQWIEPKHHHRYREPKFIPGHDKATKPRKRYKNPPPEVTARTGYCECGCGQKTNIATITQTARRQYAEYPARYAHGHSASRPPGTRRATKGRVIDSRGYVLIKAPSDHPRATKAGYILEHRLVLERTLGRYLERHETVHHINDDKQNNQPENLQLRSGNHGRGAHRRCGDCGSYNIVDEPI